MQWGRCHLRCHRRRLRKRTQLLPMLGTKKRLQTYKGEERALYEAKYLTEVQIASENGDSAATRHFSKLLETAKLPRLKE